MTVEPDSPHASSEAVVREPIDFAALPSGVFDESVLADVLGLDLVAASPVSDQLFDAFVTDAAGCLEAMNAAISVGDPDALFAAAHGLKGTAGLIGAIQVYDGCEELCAAARARRLDGAISLLERTVQALERVRSAWGSVQALRAAASQTPIAEHSSIE